MGVGLHFRYGWDVFQPNPNKIVTKLAIFFDFAHVCFWERYLCVIVRNLVIAQGRTGQRDRTSVTR